VALSNWVNRRNSLHIKQISNGGDEEEELATHSLDPEEKRQHAKNLKRDALKEID